MSDSYPRNARLLSPVRESSARTQGWLFIHACRRAFVTHVESELSRLLGSTVMCTWADQPLMSNACRAEITWRGPVGTAGVLMSSLRMFPRIYAEATAEPAGGELGMRYALVPDLGLWSAVMAASGEAMLGEHQIREVMVLPQAQAREEIDRLLGQPWDCVLEPMRANAERIPSTLLRVV